MQISTTHSELLNRHDSLGRLNSRQDAAQQTPEDAKQLATDRLLNKLAQHVPGMTGAQDFKQLDANDFTPDKVANRITDYVAMGLSRARSEGKSEAEVEKLRQDAISGIEKGFREAREILDNMNLLSDEIATGIDQTEKLTMEGLAGLAPGAQPSLPVGNSTSVLAAERFQSAETLSLKVKTQDGDIVTIQFAKDSDYQASFGGYSDDSGSAVSYSVDRSESSNYRFSVQGELDNDEIDALQTLIKDVNEIANDFFDGDVQAAFEQASEFQMDKTELASMNLRLTRSQSYSAVSAYQQVQNQGFENSDPGRKLGHLIQGIKDSFSNPDLGFVESPFKLGKDLLSGLVSQDMRFKEADEVKQNLFEQALDTMRSIIDELEQIQPLEQDD